MTGFSTTTTGSSTVSPTGTTQKVPSTCYDCSGPGCGNEGSSTSPNCPSCMVYRNPNDPSKCYENFSKYISIDILNSEN